MTLKILGGKFGGRLLKSPQGTQTRPTTSLLRKAVFDIVQPFIHDTVFLDLFAGSGAMGIEAISRGARQAIFIDSSRNSIDALKYNISLLNLENETQIIQSDAFKALKRLDEMHVICDLIYVDPPYHNLNLYREILQFMDQSKILKEGGHLLMECPLPSPFENKLPSLLHLHMVSPRKYGASMLYHWIRKNR